jgi:hypothetical protein
MSNKRGHGGPDLWQDSAREARYQQRPVQRRALVVVGMIVMTLLAIQVRDVMRFGFWLRSTPDMALLLFLASVLVGLGLLWRRAASNDS